MAEENVSTTLTIAAPAEKVFAVLADPTTHASIDGTGWVRGARDRAPLTEMGQVFGMDMYHPNHPDGDYTIHNRVVVLDAPRTIGWMPGSVTEDGQLELGGWVWRYDLASRTPAETELTLTYDWSAVPPAVREHIQFPPFESDHLTNSLTHLADLVASDDVPAGSEPTGGTPER